MRALIFLLLLTGCQGAFDTQAAAVMDLERVAYTNREYDRPNREIRYRFVDDANTACRIAGTVARIDATIGGCAEIGKDPCVIIIPWAPLPMVVREEQLHCRYGNWHK